MNGSRGAVTASLTPRFFRHQIIMANCKEYFLDDVMAITAIPIEDISASDPGSVVNNLTPLIPSSSFNPTLTHAVTIGLQPVVSGGTLIPIRRKTGKAKDDESNSVAGVLHTVSVNCEVDDRDADVWTYLLQLERTPSHLLLSFRGGDKAFVSATEDTYLFTLDRDGAKTSVTFRIQNLMGIQLIA